MNIVIPNSTSGTSNDNLPTTLTHFCQDCQTNCPHTFIERVEVSVSYGHSQESASALLQCDFCKAFTLTDISIQ